MTEKPTFSQNHKPILLLWLKCKTPPTMCAPLVMCVIDQMNQVNTPLEPKYSLKDTNAMTETYHTL